MLDEFELNWFKIAENIFNSNGVLIRRYFQVVMRPAAKLNVNVVPIFFSDETAILIW
jgi:hypothetical protein